MRPVMAVHILDHVIGMNALTTTGFATECFPQEIWVLACTAAHEVNRRIIRPDIGQFVFTHTITASGRITGLRAAGTTTAGASSVMLAPFCWNRAIVFASPLGTAGLSAAGAAVFGSAVEGNAPFA